jgi:excisionase family DNA binding protein
VTDTPDYISPTEAAQMLGVHTKTLKRWASAGKIPAWRTPGGWWRFSRSELAVWHAARHTDKAAS